MASAGDGDIGEAAEAATPTRNRRTIHDYLGEGEDGEEASPPSPETPPRLRLPTLTCARIRFGRLGRKRGGRGGRKEVTAAEKCEDASVDSSGWKQAAAGSSSSGSGGGIVAAGQTGMGLSMLFLLARTCVELNRMAEVRAQMETLLKEIRDEASRVKGAAADDHVVLVTPKACNNLQSSSSTTTTTTAASSSCVSDDTSTTNCLEIRQGEDDGERASEAELETEPAARRHQPPECKCDTEQETPGQVTQCSVQLSSDDDGEFIELEGGRFGTGGGNSQGDAVVVDESDGVESCERQHEGGVSATELERRLHELQHRRDRERIEALESALRRAQRKLTEKEMEARLWQDTATLALGQPVPVPVPVPRDRDGQ